VTGADGRFAFEGVATPYDVTMFDAAEGWAHRTVGLTETAVELAPYPPFVEVELAGASTATVEGAFAAPLGAGQRARVCVDGHDRPVLGCATVFAGLALYEIEVQWMGGPLDATVRAVVFDLDDGGNASGVAAHGSAPVALDPGGFGTADMTLIGLAGEAALEVALDAPVGYPLDGAWALTTRSGGRFSVQGPGAAPQAPLPGAVGIGPETPFTIDAPDGQLHVFGFEPQGDGPSLYVSTAATTARIPDLSAISDAFALPSGAGYDGSVASATGGGARLAAGGGVHGPYGRLANASAGGGGGPSENGAIAASAGGAFTLE
jgi:hypothetical protein